MRLKLEDIRDYIQSLSLSDYTYCGRIDDKNEKSIGIYPMSNPREKRRVIGGESNTSYGTKAITFFVHWNESPTESEDAAYALYEALEQIKNVTVNECTIKFIILNNEEPINVDKDETGIFEYTIDCTFYYER